MKKVSLLMAAFALVLGFSQCSKKPVMPSYSGPVGDRILQDITLSATRGNGGGDSKVSVVDNNLQWDKEDVITVLDEDKTELGELHFVEYGKKDGVEDKTSAVFESRGPIPCPREGKLTFTVGTVGKEGYFQNQAGDGKSLYLAGEATCDGTGNYSAEMKAVGYALLKLNMSAFVSVGTKDGEIQMTIESGEDKVSVANIAEISNPVYVAVPAPVKERFYTITCKENKAVKNWKALEENTFYTKEGTAGEAIVIELPKKEIPVAEPEGEPAATGVSLTYYIDGTDLIEDGVVYSENEDMSDCTKVEYESNKNVQHTVMLTGLTPGATYYVRVYAKYKGSQETVYGEQTDFTTDIVPTTPKFTVGMDGDKPITVEFSKGNLWYGTEDDAKPQEKAFHFEANQWDFASTWDASHVSHFFWSNTTDWQTSGKEPYAESYTYNTQTTGDVFFTNAAEMTANPDFHMDGETGKNQWRTLSNGEWAYLLNTSGSSGRNDANRFAKAKVKGVCGLLIFPDGYTLPSDYTTADGGTGMAKVNKTSSTDAPWPDASIPETTWTLMESAGVVFLPAAGSRTGTSVTNAGNGYYWSSTPHENNKNSAYRMRLLSGTVDTNNIYSRGTGCSVRLVR